MLETWYILEDGSVGDPREIRRGPDGKFVHKDGRKVAYAPHGPRTRGGVDAAAERAKAGGSSAKVPSTASDPDSGHMVGDDTVTATRELRPEKPRRSYRTRESKAD